jgi:hypothetical protein
MLADYRAIVDDKLRDTADKVTAAQRHAAIAEAVKDYSRWRPRVALSTITGDGSAYTFALPVGFEDGWSTIRAVEYPVTEQAPVYLEAGAYMLYRQVAGTLVLRLSELVLTAGEQAYLSYTARHTVNTTTDTIAEGDREIVAGKAAAICLRELAAYYAQTSEPTLGADAVNYRSKSQEYLALAAALETAYELALGIAKESETQAASAIGDLDVEFQEIGGPRFFHGNRWR